MGIVINFSDKLYGIGVLGQAVKPASPPPELGPGVAAGVMRWHRSIPGYSETPLVSLAELSKKLGVKGIYAKDESGRFGLNAFKGLGGSYAMYRILCERLGLNPTTSVYSDFSSSDIRQKAADITFVTATDGNHGKGVAWAAGMLGCKAHVLMPAGSSQARAEAIRAAGAEVTITDMNYDATVRHAAELAEGNGWYLIQDTAWDGYEQVPLWIIQGYLTMAAEAAEQLERHGVRPTHVFLQAGVGAMAGGVLGYLAHRYADDMPVVAIVEPEAAACVYLSMQRGDGTAHSVEGDPQTIMAGLNCGTPCKTTWPVLRDHATYYFSCPDYVAAHGMRLYAAPARGDAAVVSGESGAVTLGLAALLCERAELREVKGRIGIDEQSVILVLSTEGDTDPACYSSIVGQGAYPLP